MYPVVPLALRPCVVLSGEDTILASEKSMTTTRPACQRESLAARSPRLYTIRPDIPKNQSATASFTTKASFTT